MDRIMDFQSEYKKIADCVKQDISDFEKFCSSMFSENTDIEDILANHLAHRGKMIRPLLVFLFTRAAGLTPDERHFSLAFCVEMLHNASLIHDDIIDDACERRGELTLHNRFDSRFAVIAGDYLLAMAIESLASLKNTEIINIFSRYIKKLITGETKQYFSRYDSLSMDDYIEKSANKTASLFQATLESVSLINKGNDLCDFARNFGIAFQIHNDLKNFEENAGDDLKNGVYTAPVIFYLKKNNMTKINNLQDFLNSPDRAYFREKTRELVEKFGAQAIENIKCLEDNQYKRAIIDLCRLYFRG